MDIVIAKLTPADTHRLSQLLDIYEEVFSMNDFTRPTPDYLERLMRDPAVVIFVALYEEMVVGGLTGYSLPSVYEESRLLYLYDLGVTPDWQRQGAGTALIRALLDHCALAGISEVFVQADLPDEHAIRFYTKNGGSREDVVHFSFSTV